MRIELGGGLAPAPGYTNIDPVHGEGELRRQAQDVPWPFADGSVEAARCSHVLEHIPAGGPRLAVFNEMWRVLRVGGTWEIIVPLVTPNAAGASYGAIADPTHVSLWCRESFWYFTGRMAAAADYGLRLWEEVGWTAVEWDWGTEGHCVLRKPTPGWTVLRQ